MADNLSATLTGATGRPILPIVPVFSKSGSSVEGAIDNALQRMVSNNSAFSSLVNSVLQTSQGGANTSPSSQVVSDYRKASMHLPKYYMEAGQEKLATITIINALQANSQESDNQNDEGGADIGSLVTKGADSQPMNSFLLTGVQEAFQERHQIVETFGDDFGVFFTGETPKIFNFQGVLINDAYRNWKSKFIQMYIESLRGSELARQRIKAVVTYDYIAVEGYVFNLVCNTESLNEADVPFRFDMLVTKYDDFGQEGFTADPQLGGQLGQPLYSSSAAILTSALTSLATRALPGIQGSPLLSPVMSTIDRTLNQVIPGQSLAQLSGGTFLASNLMNVSNPARIPNIINEAIAVVAATSTPVAPATSQLLGMFSPVVSGNFGDAVNAITKTAGQFSGNNSPASSVVSQFSNTLKNVSSSSVPGVLGLSPEATSNLNTITTMATAKGLLGQTNNARLEAIPLVLSLQDILNTLSTGN